MTSTTLLLRSALGSAACLLFVGCAAPVAGDGERQPSESALAEQGPETAPRYDGEGFQGARILRVEDGSWLTVEAFAEALSAADVTLFGEKHQTAPVQALERWVFAALQGRDARLAVAMEHFQRDEQPVIDRYFAGAIDQATFEAQAQVWPGYATYWRPVVEDARAAGSHLLGLNVPKEVLSPIYGEFPEWPLDVFNRIASESAASAHLPPRPLAAWDATYQGWFETGFDYESHGQGMGLDYPAALHYFTDLAHIRDETMAHWIVRGLERHPRVLVFAGDWHVQTGLALSDRVQRSAPAAKLLTITTAPDPDLEATRAFVHAGRRAADYVISYAPPPP